MKDNIPFQFFAIISIITAGLFAYGLIPEIGPLKKATKSAESAAAVEAANEDTLATLGGPEILFKFYAF